MSYGRFFVNIFFVNGYFGVNLLILKELKFFFFLLGIDCSMVLICYNVFNCFVCGICIDYDVCKC